MVEPRLDSEVVHNETDLLVAAIYIDRYLMAAMGRLDKDFSEIHALSMQTFKQLSRNKHVLNDIILSDKEAPSEDVTRNLEKITLYNEQMEEKINTPKSRLQRLCKCCERSFVFYNAIVETTADEAVRLAAEKLASFAQDRIGILKRALGRECECDG